MTPEPGSPLRRLPVLVALVTFVAFLPSMAAGFVNWDDDLNFLENPNYRGFSAATLKWMCTASHLGHYHPLTWFTLALDYTIWGMNPFGYHLTSVLIHCANAALLMLAIAACLRLAGRPASPWACAAGALFAAIHPLRVESVTWVTERRDVLCGLFTLLSVLFYFRHAEDEREGRGSRRWLALSVVFFGASLFSKALSIALPAVLLILDVYPLRRFRDGARGRVLLEKAPYLLLCLIDGVLMLSAARQISALHAGYDLPARVGQAAYGLCFYVLKTLWPTRLAPLYRYDPSLKAWDVVYLASIAAVILVTALLIARRRSWPGPLAAWLSYAVLVAPTLGIVVTGMQIAADRYTYLALLPASFLIADLLGRLAAPPKRIALTAAAVLSILGALTWRQTLIWKDSESLWTRQIELDPDDNMARQNRAYARHARGELRGALADYTVAIARDPSIFKPILNRAILRAMQEDHPGAIEDFTAAIRLQPGNVEPYVYRALSRSKRGDRAGALDDYTKALELDPNQAETRTRRGVLRSMAGDLKGAIDDFDAALRLRPDAAAFVRRATARAMTGDLDGAVADCTEAIRLKPDYLDAYVRRGVARMERGDRNGAAADFEQALRQAPAGWPQRAQIEEFLRGARPK